ncbi:hypothetical protein ACHAQJ_000804 [Trichoderma viride]
MSSLTDPFFEDLKEALIILTTTAADACCGAPTPFVMLTPAPIIYHSGCWCGIAKEHSYISCPHAASKPRQNTIAPLASPVACFHADEKERDSRSHTLFCFNVAATTDLFMEWFIQQRIFRRASVNLVPTLPTLPPSPPLPGLPPMELRDHLQRDAIMRIAQEYEERSPKNKSWVSTDLKFNMLCRLLTDLQKGNIPDEARLSNISWQVERVHAVLGWQYMGFDETLMKLTVAMRMAMAKRYGS